VKKCVVKDHSVQLVEIADALGDPLNCSVTHRLLLFIADLIFSFGAQYTRTFGEVEAIWRLTECISSAVQKGCLEQCYTRFNHECTHKTQITYVKIKCALKISSCDTPFSKNLKLTILASNASSSSTKEIKCPHTKE
ncbi:hypothetical protein H5410_056203, partial [Solanum commersonii]